MAWDDGCIVLRWESGELPLTPEEWMQVAGAAEAIMAVELTSLPPDPNPLAD